MPKKSKSNPRARKPKSFYKSPPPKAVTSDKWQVTEKSKAVGRASPRAEKDFSRAKIISSAHFSLREDGSIQEVTSKSDSPLITHHSSHITAPITHHSSRITEPITHHTSHITPAAPQLIYTDTSRGVWLYHGNSLELLDAIAAKYPEGRFDAIFADPPYFLSNGGITCHAGKMVKVDKGDWDISRGAELNHEFNREWLLRCQRVLKPNGTLWVSGTHHVIFSIGYAMQQLGYKILNDIAWEKPNPPPNLSCRYFTHSTETILWAAKNEKSKHVFNYHAMRAVTGKQMKTVWRDLKVTSDECRVTSEKDSPLITHQSSQITEQITHHSPHITEPPNNIWTLTAPGSDEKQHGRHPTQKPVALIERCLLASTREGDLVLDPFLGGGTTAIAALKLNRACVGIELDESHATLAVKRIDGEIISIWLRKYQMLRSVTIFIGNDLDLFCDSINGSRVDDKPQIETERIYHECKFVFLSCAQVERGAVVHTIVDVSLQEAWAKTPNGKKRETTHVVRCETEIFRIKQN